MASNQPFPTRPAGPPNFKGAGAFKPMPPPMPPRAVPWPTLGIVTGLRAEARIVAGIYPRVAVGGGTPQGAERAAEHLVATGADFLLSFGVAGGLAPVLIPGALVIPRYVVAAEGRYETTAILPAIGTLYAARHIVATAAEKADLFRRSGALGVDLESGAIARVAARHNLPFAVIRAICDPAERDLPEAALLAIDAQGKVAIWGLLRSVLRRPRQIPALRALARDMAAAREGLRICVAQGGFKPPPE